MENQPTLPFEEPTDLQATDLQAVDRHEIDHRESDEEHLELVLDRSDIPPDEDPRPTLPSIDEADRDAYLRLCLVPGLGIKTMAKLLARFGSATAVVSATLRELGEVTGIGPKMAASIREGTHGENLERVIEHCRDHEVDLVLPGDPGFPAPLRELVDPPLMLFIRGRWRPTDAMAIGMVGTRHATYYGRQMADRLARGLCRFRMTIVSGLARGIDAVCHQSAMESEGRTIAVLGGSVTEVYPPEHAELAQRIVEQGALISETPPFTRPRAGVFPQRNRLISGLSLGVVVVEAADRSGSLITARHAGEQGRDVFAVPGPVTSRTSRGCNQLIRDGAILIQDAEDVIEHLGPLAHPTPVTTGEIVRTPSELQLNEIEQAVLRSIDSHATDIDVVIARAGLPVPRVLSTLSVLEMRGWIVRTGGRSVARRF